MVLMWMSVMISVCFSVPGHMVWDSADPKSWLWVVISVMISVFISVSGCMVRDSTAPGSRLWHAVSNHDQPVHVRLGWWWESHPGFPSPAQLYWESIQHLWSGFENRVEKWGWWFNCSWLYSTVCCWLTSLPHFVFSSEIQFINKNFRDEVLVSCHLKTKRLLDYVSVIFNLGRETCLQTDYCHFWIARHLHKMGLPTKICL